MAHYVECKNVVRIYSKWYDRVDMSSFISKDKLVDYYMSHGYEQKYFDMICEFIEKYNIKSIIGFGSGLCVFEFLLKKKYPGLVIAATDYNEKCIYNAKKFFPELKLMLIDFYKQNIYDVIDEFGHGFDLALFRGCSYAMNDSRFVPFMSAIRESNVKYIIDSPGGIIDDKPSTNFCKFKQKHPIFDFSQPFGYGRLSFKYVQLYMDAKYILIKQDFYMFNCGLEFMLFLEAEK